MFKRFLTKQRFVLLAFCWVISVAMPLQLSSGWQMARWATQPAIAQPILRTEDIAPRVYQLVPGLPLENQYVNQETQQVSQNNTLVSRLIRYHIYTKSRTPAYRLDWKLTLADYLGANERIAAAVYPSADALQTNPLEGDIAAIQRLTRSQRNALVQVLVNIFTPTAASAEPSAPASAAPAAPVSPSRLEPRPGDAQLLMP